VEKTFNLTAEVVRMTVFCNFFGSKKVNKFKNYQRLPRSVSLRSQRQLFVNLFARNDKIDIPQKHLQIFIYQATFIAGVSTCVLTDVLTSVGTPPYANILYLKAFCPVG
jgi:hypothetical protein